MTGGSLTDRPGREPGATPAPRRRRLGRTGLLVSEIGLGGAWLLGRDGRQPVAAGVATIHHALALGVTYLDTARRYIAGRSEGIFGEALAGYVGEHVLATKCAAPAGTGPAGAPEFEWTRAGVLRSVEFSCRQLRRESVDVLQLHTPETPPIEAVLGPGGALEGLREARERGWCRFLGITGRDLAFLRRCVDADAFDILLTFQRFDLLEQSGRQLMAEAAAHDMGVILGSPLRLGLFGSARDVYFASAGPDDRRQIETLEALVADRPGGITAAAIQFCLTLPEVSVVLSGAATPAEIESAVAASATPFPAHLLAEVYRLGAGQQRILD
jgi:L-galactose dehydrogenase